MGFGKEMNTHITVKKPGAKYIKILLKMILV